MANIPLKLEQLDMCGGIVVKEIETRLTAADGFTYFKTLPGNDEKDNKICYRLTELRTEANKYFILAEPVEFTKTANSNFINLVIENNPKNLTAPIYKAAEENLASISADGSVWGLYDSVGTLIQQVTIKDGLGLISGLTYEELGDDVAKNYWQEISTGNDALVLDTNKHYLSAIDWNTIEDGDSITVAGNAQTTPFVNKIKRIAISGVKMNEYKKPLQHVHFSVFSEDTEIITPDGLTEMKQNKVADLVTDKGGNFQSKLYPIYLFDNKYLNYVQETATLEYLDLVTSKINIPTINKADYGKYQDKQVIELFTKEEPLINYNLRLGLGLYKMNEDKEFLPGVTYGLYDGEKRQLATAITKDDGLLLIENIRFDIFINKEESSAKTVSVYIREIKVQDEQKYTLDYTKYELPNLYGKQSDYNMNDIIMLNTKETAFVNTYISADGSIHKTDDSGEQNLSNVPFLFTRKTGDVIEGIETVTDTNRSSVLAKYKSLPKQQITKPEGAKKDSQDQFLLYTDENGKIPFDKNRMLYGEWLVDEMESPLGYMELKDVEIDSKQIKFTINKAMQPINLRFYNTKKAEILAVTGNSSSTMLILLGIGIISLSALFLWLGLLKVGKHRKRLLGAVLVLFVTMTIGGNANTLHAASIITKLPEIIENDALADDDNVTSIVANSVDPFDPHDPIRDKDPITNPTPPASEDIDGKKPLPPTNDGDRPVEEVPVSNSSEKETHATASSQSILVRTGEKTVLYAIFGVYTLIGGIVIYLCSRFVKQRK
ncbi:MAG: hypothetical protein ACRCZK_03640 [Oscillospiraceae bacterium]